ncbi:hypothetical protein ACWCPQ_13310 [Nocardia sp. NPDC001965]
MERRYFWFGVLTCVALSVSAVEIVRTSGSRFVLGLVFVSIVVMGVSLFRRRAESGIRFGSSRHDR